MALDAGNIKLIILDFDGVLTDNFVYVDEYGDESVRCCKSDSTAIYELKRKGYEFIVLSNERKMYVKERCKKLGLHFRMLDEEKANSLESVKKIFKVKESEILFVGNDLNDIGLMKTGVKTACPSDSAEEVIKIVDLVLETKGGYGITRELFRILK